MKAAALVALTVRPDEPISVRRVGGEWLCEYASGQAVRVWTEEYSLAAEFVPKKKKKAAPKKRAKKKVPISGLD